MLKQNILLWMILFLLISNTFVTLSINVAIISMVRPMQKTQIQLNETRSKPVICPNTTFYWSSSGEEVVKPISINNLDDTYEWNDYEKRTVLSAYHWLSWLSILPGSILAQKYGTKVVVGYASCISSVMSSVIPLVADYGAYPVTYVRMIQGFFSFIAIPGGLMAIVGNWSTSEARGKFLAVILVGSSLGLGFGNKLFGYMGQYLHWKYIFHLTSVCGIIWTLMWYFLVHDFPDQHPTITLKEKTKILGTTGHKIRPTTVNIPIPWKEIFTSIPVLVTSLINGAMIWYFVMSITFMPSYLNDTYGLDSNQVGTIVGLPQLISGLSGIGFGWFADCLIKKRWLSITNIRKSFSLVGCLVSTTPLIIMVYIKCNITVTIICYVLCTVTRGIATFGVDAALVDMSPKFCGILQGLLGTESELISFLFSVGMSHLSKFLPNEEFWKVVFLFTASITISTSILFVIWGSAQTQLWNEGSKKVRAINNCRQSEAVELENLK